MEERAKPYQREMLAVGNSTEQSDFFKNEWEEKQMEGGTIRLKET